MVAIALSILAALVVLVFSAWWFGALVRFWDDFLTLDEFNEHLVLLYRELGCEYLRNLDLSCWLQPWVMHGLVIRMWSSVRLVPFLLRRSSTTNVFKHLSKLPNLLVSIFGAHRIQKIVWTQTLKMASGTRKTHIKSRNGCSQCKARRKKVRDASIPLS